MACSQRNPLEKAGSSEFHPPSRLMPRYIKGPVGICPCTEELPKKKKEKKMKNKKKRKKKTKRKRRRYRTRRTRKRKKGRGRKRGWRGKKKMK